MQKPSHTFSLQDAVLGVIRDVAETLGPSFADTGASELAPRMRATWPSVELRALSSATRRFSVALPGWSKDELDIQISGPVLTISGEPTANAEEGKVLASTLERDAFSRRYRVFPSKDRSGSPTKVDVANAVLVDGILHIDLLKLGADTRKVEIR